MNVPDPTRRSADPTPAARAGRHPAGRPDHHDPTAGLGGAPPAHSALTLRLVLASFGLVVCTVGAVLAAGAPELRGMMILMIVLAVVAAVDIVVIIRRKRRGEPG
ncbi:hypothetical protein J4G33_02345 [Actinotalea sp. BY-33]|uniref:Uncharacterized protein n=1 Tax=Actinotalea soli TaxID=2819234 RepID=A0A939RT77_9CELL|nr:DUF6343 family protein [Actinotalea soli]MBO1750639.1 hypothetical protein [Actinotalea soli]